MGIFWWFDEDVNGTERIEKIRTELDDPCRVFLIANTISQSSTDNIKNEMKDRVVRIEYCASNVWFFNFK